MKILILSLLPVSLLTGGLWAGEATAGGGDPRTRVDLLVARVQERFDGMTDLRADVSQDVAVASLGRSVEANGTVAFKRPGKMRWELKGEEEQTIVADGVTIWFYQREDEQVLKAPLGAVFRSSTPVSFLTGVGRIADDFSAELEAESEASIDLVLTPRNTSGDIGRLLIRVDPKTFDIVAARITDPVGNVTNLRFSNLRRNVGIGDDEFVFAVPPGIDVVEAPIGY